MMMQYQDTGDDDQSIYIRLDDILPPLPRPETTIMEETTFIEPRTPPTPRRGPVRPRYEMFPSLEEPVEGSPGHSTRQLLNEKALAMYSDDESVYLTESNDEVRCVTN